MSDSKHTPGPWIAKQEFANRWRIESHANGPEFIPISVGIACTTVLEIGCNNEDTAANAHLISAAPDLLLNERKNLISLRAARDRIAGHGWQTVDLDAAIDATELAIAKAEGRS